MFVKFTTVSKCCKTMQNLQTVRNWKITPFSFTNCAWLKNYTFWLENFPENFITWVDGNYIWLLNFASVIFGYLNRVNCCPNDLESREVATKFRLGGQPVVTMTSQFWWRHCYWTSQPKYWGGERPPWPPCCYLPTPKTWVGRGPSGPGRLPHCQNSLVKECHGEKIFP